MTDGMSAAEAAVLLDRRDGYRGDCGLLGGAGGAGGIIGLIAILGLLGAGGGFFGGGNRGGSPVTEADLCNANSFNELKGAVGRLSDQNNNLSQGLNTAICSLGYETLRNFNNIEQLVSRCCCETQRAVDGAVFTLSKQLAENNSTTVSAMQRVLDKLAEDKAERQAARIQQLELQQALCGVVRYPLQTTYNAGYNPYFYNNQCGRAC